MTAPGIEALVARALRCHAGGYRPVPVLRHDAPAFVTKGGKRQKQSPGKQPHNGLWARKEDEVYGATPDKLARWARLRDIGDHPGLGIACGAVAAADLDVYDPPLADRVEALAVEHLGATPLRRVGQAPKRLLAYRVDGDGPLHKAQTPELFKGSLDGPKAKVEVLGRGQQFVAYGTHPATGMPFAWGAATPETTPLADLPAVNRDQVEAFVAAAERLLRAEGYRTRAEIEASAAGSGEGRAGANGAAKASGPAPGRWPNGGGAGPFKAVNDEALRRIEAWVPDLFGAKARRHVNGAWRVGSHELGRGLEEDLSIAPTGIVDFGVHDMGDPRQGKRTPIDLVVEHGGAPDAKRAAAWLAERLGMTLEIGRRARQANGKTWNKSAETSEGDRAGTPSDGRVELRLAEERINDAARRCAGLLADEMFMRGSLAAVLVRVEEAPGVREADDGGEDEVKVEVEPGVLVGGVRHARGSLVFAEPAPERVQFRLDEKARFLRLDGRSGEWVPKSCPTALARRIIGAAADIGFRPCGGIVTVPLFIKGQVVAIRGYHASTGLLLDYRGPPPAVPARPTRGQARRALLAMLRPFRGYLAGVPREHRKRLRAALAAAVLTAVLRPSLPTAPAVLLDANQPGAGKGKLARALAVVASGRLPAIITEGHSEEETEKRLAAAVLSGAPCLLLDNLQRTLASSTLESGLTEGVATIRPFGRLTDTTVPCSALALITANNAALRPDMLRRTLPVRIVVDTEAPELRRFGFDPYEEAKRDRSAIVAAALTVARAWWLARDTGEGRRIRETTLGSFEAWADLVAGAVAWLSGVNPVSLIEERKAEDPRKGDERALVAALYGTFGGGEWKAGEAAGKVDPQTWAGVVRFKGEKPTGREIGGWLRARRDRVFGSYALRCRNEPGENVTLWRVEKSEDSPSSRDMPGHTGHAATSRAKDGESHCDISERRGRNMSRMSRHVPADPDHDAGEVDL